MTDAGFEIAGWVLRILIALVFVGMGINHFLPGPARVMAELIPPGLRGTGLVSPLRLVYFTGACEIAGGIGLLVPQTRFAAMAALVVFLVAVFPANAYASQHRERFGAIAIPFWPRYAAQVGLILLVVLAGI